MANCGASAVERVKAFDGTASPSSVIEPVHVIERSSSPLATPPSKLARHRRILSDPQLLLDLKRVRGELAALQESIPVVDDALSSRSPLRSSPPMQDAQLTGSSLQHLTYAGSLQQKLALAAASETGAEEHRRDWHLDRRAAEGVMRARLSASSRSSPLGQPLLLSTLQRQLSLVHGASLEHRVDWHDDMARLATVQSRRNVQRTSRLGSQRS